MFVLVFNIYWTYRSNQPKQGQIQNLQNFMGTLTKKFSIKKDCY